MARRARPAQTEPVPLLAGAYQARTLIAGVQRCVNLYPEANIQGQQSLLMGAPSENSQAPVQVVHLQTPGMLLATAAPVAQPFRKLGLYLSTTLVLYMALGGSIYRMDSQYNFTFLGAIADANTPLSWADNGIVLVITDGTATAYVIDLTSNAFGTMGAAQGYIASSCVAYIDTFFAFVNDGTNQWYISLSNVSFAMLTGGTGFDPLDIAAKTGQPDPIQWLLVVNGVIWLIGSLTSEIWQDNGGAEFTFERIPGAVIPHGTAAKYSVAQTDTAGYFVMQDKQGRGIVVMTEGYALRQISTYVMDQEIQGYTQIDDAFGYTRQAEGHAFYVVTFPTADKTWAIELSTSQPHEWSSVDTNNNGIDHRHRANCYAAAYGMNFVGDSLSNQLCTLDRKTFQDLGQPIKRVRTFPHIIENQNRIEYVYFVANLECGLSQDGAANPMCSLRWSDDRGYSYGNAIQVSMGLQGKINTWPRWNKLGMARDRVFELSWSENVDSALGGAWISMRPFLS